MSDFNFYFRLGWDHIVSINAADHILFLLAVMAVYLPGNYKNVLVLVTAFTIGHSLTLALSTYDIIRFSSAWVEFLIPLTIVITAVKNLFSNSKTTHQFSLNYLVVFCFGLIHGMGFANNIRMMMIDSESIALPLFSFNVGLEAGQIIIVAFILMLAFIWVKIFRLKQIWWIRLLSGLAAIAGVYFCLTRMPF